MQGTALHRLSLAVTAATLALSLGACRQGGDATPAAAKGGDRPDREWTDAARVEAIASALQACSYEGNAQNIVPGTLNGPAPGDCRAMVDKIMGYTGLPANFIVTAGPVDNAAAVILPDQQRIPQRVIAFNPDFINATQRITGGGQWGPISIMAHEIGHHLSGHTITNGGSRPGIELEADKFSGFVLYKMGAPLVEATRAIDKLGSEVEQATHPSKTRRIAAITQGWQEACRQGGGSCSGGTASTQPAPTPSPGATTTPAPAPAPAPTPASPAPTMRTVSLPAPSAQSIPFKYGRFVVDETGKLDPGALRALDAKLLDLARSQGIELALLVVNDLHGMSAQDYAWAMLRQLRIGKLDLGNGGVFVVAPGQGTSGVAFAPGVAKQLQFAKPEQMFDGWTAAMWQRYCNDADGCGASSSGLLAVVESQLRSIVSQGVKFEVRFDNIQDIIDFGNARRAERKAGRKWDDKVDQSIGSLVRFSATVTELDPKPEFLRVNEATVKDGTWRAVLVKTQDGKETTLYMQPQTEALMPGGKLQVGQPYTFTGELKTAGQFTTDAGVKQGNVELWLYSYDPLG